ncbi:MAG: hypothetical protein NZL87_08440, partial [Thermomicrobium sp.]|nr:hypothetical protein [Thermomicrobium sp.]
KRRHKPSYRPTGIVGVLLAFVAAILLAAAFLVATNWVRYVVVIVALPLSIVAILLIARAIAMRLRLQIEVYDKEGKSSDTGTGHVVSLLWDLGAAPPRGMEIPVSSDVTSLTEETFKELPHGKWAAAVVALGRWIFGTTPWRIRVDEESADLLSVTITHNGRVTDSAVIDRDALELRAPIRGDSPLSGSNSSNGRVPDLHVFAAAAVMTSLAARYEGFEALAGVTHWRSLGLHYVATVDYRSERNTRESQRALVNALGVDPQNLSALVALHHRRYRKSVESTELRLYIDWLTDLLRDPILTEDHAYAIALRIRMALAAATLNYWALSGGDKKLLNDVRESTQQLIKDLRTPRDEAESLVENMRPSASAALLSLLALSDQPGRRRRVNAEPMETLVELAETATSWLAQPERFNTLARYNYACMLARDHVWFDHEKGEVQRKESEVARAVENLRLASLDPEL